MFILYRPPGEWRLHSDRFLPLQHPGGGAEGGGGPGGHRQHTRQPVARSRGGCVNMGEQTVNYLFENEYIDIYENKERNSK